MWHWEMFEGKLHIVTAQVTTLLSLDRAVPPMFAQSKAPSVPRLASRRPCHQADKVTP